MIQEVIRVNNKREKKLILNFLNEKNIKWASGEEANCKRMRDVIPDKFNLIIIDNLLYWNTMSYIKMVDMGLLNEIKTVKEYMR